MKDFIVIVLFSFFLYFFSWFVVFKLNVNNLIIQSEDTIPALFLPVTIIKHQTFYADNYYEFIRNRYPHPDDSTFEKGLVPYYFRKVVVPNAAHYITAFPVITGLLAIPVFVIPLYFGMPITFENLSYLGHIASSIIVALSGGFLFLLLKNYLLQDSKKSAVLTIIYLFSTINFALVSQALWQHGTLELFTILGLLFVYKPVQSDPKSNIWLILSGVMFSFGVLSRPTAALFIPFIVFLIINKKQKLKSLLFYFLGFIPALIFFVWYNTKYFISLSNQGYSNQIFSEWLSPFPEGFLGLWLSPSKGILIYSPILIFALVSLFIIFKNKSFRSNIDFIIFALIVLTHTLVMGKWKHWYGGWSFGYRMASDVIPFLVLLIIPYITSNLFDKTKRIFYTLIVLSVVIQIYGIIFFDGIWHAAYDRGYQNTSWLWSIKDSEIAFNMRRVMVKLNVLDSACPKCQPVN